MSSVSVLILALILNLVLHHGISSATQILSDGVYCRKAASEGPVVFKVVIVTASAL